MRGYIRFAAAVLVLTLVSPVGAMAMDEPRPLSWDTGGSGMTEAQKLGLGFGWSLVPNGRNNIQFKGLKDGDFIVVLDGSSPTGHVGLFDSRFYEGVFSYALWSANMTPRNGVQKEQCCKYRLYDLAFVMRVPRYAHRGRAVCDFAARQEGKPYRITEKRDLHSYYCSKLVWAAYHEVIGIDLDGNGGPVVWPEDLMKSRHVTVVRDWS